MRRQRWNLPIVAIFGLGMSTPVLAQPTCDASATSDWLRQPPGMRHDATGEVTGVRAVSLEVAAATRMLEGHAFVRITNMEVTRFSGAAMAANAVDRSLRPYLVRAVFPTPSPKLSVRWSGDDLHVFATGLGCSPFTDHPIIVFLGRDPARVFVMASAAL